MKKKESFPINFTPVGIASYPHLNKPDTRFDDDGVYQVDLIFNRKDAAIIEKIVNPLMNGGKHNPIKEELGEDEKPTGNYKVKFKMKAMIKVNGNHIKQQPVLTDTKGNRMRAQVGGGSQLRIAYQAIPFSQGQGGVTLRMKAVRVLDLVEYTAGVKWDQEDEGFVQAAVEEETRKEAVEIEEDDDEDKYEDF